MTTVLIADDQALVRVGLRKILESEPETAVVGEAGDGEDAVASARRLRPNVVLMDIRMPVLDGIEATRRIVAAQPGTRVLILTTFGLDGYVYDALRAGASGFMLKDAPRGDRRSRSHRRQRGSAPRPGGHPESARADSGTREDP
jgi:DNA-binding NarL/FixJ family response regulator